jgi:hypothetical protein
VLRRPGEQLDVICYKFSPHRHASVRDWYAAQNVELMFLWQTAAADRQGTTGNPG